MTLATQTLELVLYSTDECHLCKQALALLEERRRTDSTVTWKTVDISTNDALFQRYGWLIPVVRHPCEAELRWPFDAEELEEFLRANQTLI
ncbi:MAG: glutaredoxin family protein [Pseudomonadota bacterium]